jgi:hypothetical protein
MANNVYEDTRGDAMKVRELIKYWEKHADAQMSAREFTIKLPLHDAARILALTEMYPARTEVQIITELLGAALYEIEEAFPYTRGNKVITRDDHDDPVYEDVGPTSDFVHKTGKHLKQLLAEMGNTGRE